MNKKIIFTIFVIWMFWLLPIAFADSLSITDVRLVSITDNSALLNWQTNNKANSAVNYGTDDVNNSESDSNFVKDHNILITGLEKNTDYIYEVSSFDGENTAVDNNDGAYYKFHTSSEDKAPLILVDIPRYIARGEIDITGRTEINTIITVKINNIPLYKQTFIDGKINFYNVDLISNANNSIKIIAEDANGNINEKDYWIYSDLRKAEINLSKIPAFTSKKTLLIKGTVNEFSLIDVIVNKNPIYSEEGLSFSASANLEEGDNTIIIRATDNAGNINEITKVAVVDTKKPTIENIKPKQDSFYYEGKAKDDIEGITEPFAKVSLYYEMEEVTSKKIIKVKIDEETADANGYFEFENINFEKPEIRVDDILGLKGQVQLREVRPTDAKIESTEQQDSLKITLFIAVEDRAGLTAEKKIIYMVGTCWAGEIDFDIDLLPEYQRPSLLSPERLKEGTEIISFIMNLTYNGEAEQGDWQIIGVDVDLACGKSAGSLARHYEDDPRYNISCRILPNRPSVKDHNSDKSLWFIEYKRLRTEKFKNFSKDFWKNFPNNEIIFPLKVTIKYKEKEFDREKNKQVWSSLKFQTKCVSTAYFVDIPIDPRKVLPDWLLEDGIKAANSTIETLDEWIPRLEKVIEVVGISCIASFVSRLAVKIYRKFICKWETYKSKIAKKDEDKKCPAEKSTKEITGRFDLNAEELKEKCPSCSSGWTAEAKVYQAYRWTCDRIFCHTAPAGWTQDATPVQLLNAEIKSRTCAGEDIAGVNPLIKKENCYKEYSEFLLKTYVENRVQTCYQYGSDLYIYKEGNVETTSKGQEIFTLNKATVSSGKELGATPGSPTLKVIKQEGGDNFATSIDFKCKELCQRFGKEYTGNCMDEDNCRDKLENGGKEGFLGGYTNDCWVDKINQGSGNALEKGFQCCCYYSEQEVEDDKKKGEPKDWNYRDQQLYRETNGKNGYWYPDNRYIAGRDRPACFGQDHLFDYFGGDKQIPKVDPFKQHIPAFQCLCLTGIRARLVLIKSIMSGFANCFEQIKTTGEADAGVCKEMFTMYVCDLLYQVFTWFKDGCIPIPFTGGIKFGGKDVGIDGEIGSGSIAEGFKFGLGSMWETVTTAGKDLEGEYGETSFGNYLKGGEKAIARKICLAAFGFDVGLDMDSILDMTYSVQFKTSISAFGARRDFLTYNPANGLATYEYRTSWAVYPGCDIQDYQVDLVCVNLQEKGNFPGIDCSAVNDPQTSNNQAPGCGCLYSEDTYQARSKPFYRSREGFTAGLFSEGDEHKVIEDRMRFDHLRFKLNLKKGFDEKKCFPEGHEDGIFYFPIEDKTARDLIDCYVDQKGLFRCTRGIEWEKRGEAYFEAFTGEQCGGESCGMLCKDPEDGKYKACERVLFAKGERITAKVKITGKKKQCIYYKALNEKGEQINEREMLPILTGVEEDYTELVKEIKFGSVSSANFGEGDIKIDLIEGECNYDEVKAKSLGRKSVGEVEFEFVEKGDLYNIKADVSIDLGNTTKALDKSRDYTETEVKNLIFYVNGFAVKFTKFSDKCKFKSSTVDKEQKWSLYVELRYPDADNQCDTNAIDKIGVIGRETDLTKIIKVVKNRPEIPKIDLVVKDFAEPEPNTIKSIDVSKAKFPRFQVLGETKHIKHGTKIKLELVRYDPFTKLVSKRIDLGNFTAPSFEYAINKKEVKDHVLIAGKYIFRATAVVEGEERIGTVEFHVSGKTPLSDIKKIPINNIHFTSTPIKDALLFITDITGIEFVYDSLPEDKEYTLSTPETTLGSLLTVMDITYEITDDGKIKIFKVGGETTTTPLDKKITTLNLNDTSYEELLEFLEFITFVEFVYDSLPDTKITKSYSDTTLRKVLDDVGLTYEIQPDGKIKISE